MFLYLLRHADAVMHASSDAARALSEKGMEQAREVGRFCLKNRLIPELILTSPLRRAEQTARLLAEEINATKIISVAPFLACGMDPEMALNELQAYRKLEEIMLVGHEPDLGRLASRLLGSSTSGNVKVRKASLTVFELDPLRPDSAILQFSIPAKFM